MIAPQNTLPRREISFNCASKHGVARYNGTIKISLLIADENNLNHRVPHAGGMPPALRSI